jgi:hypothetical protein
MSSVVIVEIEPERLIDPSDATTVINTPENFVLPLVIGRVVN